MEGARTALHVALVRVEANITPRSEIDAEMEEIRRELEEKRVKWNAQVEERSSLLSRLERELVSTKRQCVEEDRTEREQEERLAKVAEKLAKTIQGEEERSRLLAAIAALNPPLPP